MVFQSYDLFPNMSIMDNLILAPVKAQKRKKSDVEKDAEKLLERVGLLEKKDSYPRQLSGGLTKLQVFIYIIFPQTIRRLLPSAINLLTRMIKTTSLVVLIGVVEVVKVGKQIIDASRYTVSDSALWVYGAIFLMYFVICFPFSRLSAFLGKS